MPVLLCWSSMPSLGVSVIGLKFGLGFGLGLGLKVSLGLRLNVSLGLRLALESGFRFRLGLALTRGYAPH